MKKVLLLLVSILLVGCAPSMEYVWKKNEFTGKKFKKIAVIVISKDYAVRSAVEQQVVQDLRDEGIDAVQGTTFLTPSSTKSDWKTENIAKKLEVLGVDGAIGISLVNVRDRTDYVPGDSYMYPSGYYRYGRYVYRNYDRIYTPSYYENVKEYVIESNLYDVMVTSDKENALLWKGQSTLQNPSSLGGAASSYAGNLVDYLVKNKVVLSENSKNTY